MSYQERRTIVSFVSGAGVLAAYCIYAFGRVQAGLAAVDDLKFWAVAMLTFIGIGVVVSIIIQIVYHIVLSIAIAARRKIQDESCTDKDIEKRIKAEMVEDEMDKLIELKANQVGFVVAGIGLVAGLVSLLLNAPLAVMLNIIFLSFLGGSPLSGIAQIFYYRWGVRNG